MTPAARRALTLTLTIMSGLASIPGCVSEEKGPKADAKEPIVVAPVQVEHATWASLGYRLDWQGFPFTAREARLPQITRVVPAGDGVLTQERDSTVSLVEASNGQTRWMNQLGGELTKFVGMTRESSGAALVSSESELFTLSWQVGTLERRERFDRVVNTAPVIAGNLAIYGTSVGEVLAHQMGRNFKAWGYAGRGAIDADPVQVGSTIGFVSQAGEVTFFTPGGTVAGRAKIYEGVTTNPVTDGRSMIIAGSDQSLWAFDPNGQLRWRFRTNARLTVQPTVHGTSTYLEVPGTGFVAVDNNTGKARWTNPKVGGTVVAVRGGRLLVWNGTTAWLVDPDRGDVIASGALAGVQKIVPDKFVDGNLYLTTSGGTLVKMAPRN